MVIGNEARMGRRLGGRREERGMVSREKIDHRMHCI